MAAAPTIGVQTCGSFNLTAAIQAAVMCLMAQIFYFLLKVCHGDWFGFHLMARMDFQMWRIASSSMKYRPWIFCRWSSLLHS